MKSLLILCSLVIFAKHTLQASTPDSPSYIGAVVEYHAVTDKNDGRKAAEANADHYKTIMKKAVQHEVDIIVFPESSLTSIPIETSRKNATETRKYFKDVATEVPEISKKVALCEDPNPRYKKSLKSISCAAKEFNMYVVVNHIEKEQCNNATGNCTIDFNLYNTNFVFDRKGRLISRYRKFNLYYEEGINKTETAEVSTFKTDFNVTFGQLICFDIVNEKPASSYVKNPNVTDVVMSTNWVGAITPFHYAVERQAAWSYASDVNLLASGMSDASTGATGSGIYAGTLGPIKSYHSRDTSNAIIIAEIPKVNRRGMRGEIQQDKIISHVFNQQELPTISKKPVQTRENATVAETFRAYTTELVDPAQGRHISTVCNRGLCCDFHIEVTYDKDLAEKTSAKYYRYRIAVFSGVQAIGEKITMGVETCSVLYCTGPELEDCGKDFPKNTQIVKPLIFNRIMIIRSKINIEERRYLTPTTMDLQYRPFNGSDFTYLESGFKNSSTAMLISMKPISDVAVFGIIGRKYDQDGKEATETSSATVALPSVFLTIAILVLMRWANFY